MQISDAEWKVLNALWSGHPATARDVVERLPTDTDWAYSTVKTMLARLVEKGVLNADHSENAVRYSPLISRREARKNAVRSLMNRAFDGAFAPMIQFLFQDEKLSERDRAELRRLLDAEDESPGVDR
jgi:predicted transcriptional regulator